MRTFALMLLPLLAGCLPLFETVDDACVEKPRGGDDLSPEAAEAIGRANCYRRLTGAGKVGYKRKLCVATAAHATYLLKNGLFTDAEDTVNLPPFTGKTLRDRLDKVGYELADTEKVYELIVDTSGLEITASDVLDHLIDDPYVREVLLQPSMGALCYEAAGDVAVLDVVFTQPPQGHTAHPILYPAHKQYLVPTTGIKQAWTLNGDLPPEDALPLRSPTGYPLSMIVTSDQGFAGSVGDPYGMSLVSASLTDASGQPVDMTSMLPLESPDGLWSSALFVPDAPLSPRSEYTLEATLIYNAASHSETMVFNTGDTTDLLGDGVPFVYRFGPQ